MNKSDRSLVSLIGKEAVEADWELAFGGKSKGNRHLFRVNTIAKYLQKIEGGDLFVVLCGAWVHDVALVSGSDYDQDRVRKETEKFLNSFKGLDRDRKLQIVECAVGHEQNNGDLTVEAKIVRDADAIDKMGALGVIRHIWKMTNMLENRVLNGKKDLDNLRTHLDSRVTGFMTQGGKELAEKLKAGKELFFKLKNAEQVMNEISVMAMEGRTSDFIASHVSRRQKNDWARLLENQLTCKYLENNKKV